MNHPAASNIPATLAGVIGITLLSLGVGQACDTAGSPLQSNLDSARDTRYLAASNALKAIEDGRVQALEESLPAEDAAVEGNLHPIIGWRAKVAEVTGMAKLEAIAAEYKGTPTEAAAITGTSFVNAARNYWTTGRNVERYERFLKGYLSEGVRKKEAQKNNPFYRERPFLQEAAFELLFLHAAQFFKASTRRSSPTAFFRYWQLAFGFKSQSREGFSGYVSRLCVASSIKESCKGVPHEQRAAAVNYPYYEWAQTQSTEFLKKADAKVFMEVATRYQTALKAVLDAKPAFGEDLILPESFSSRAASNGLYLILSPNRGVHLGGNMLSETYTGALPKDLKKAAVERIQALKDTPGNTIDFERVVMEAPADTPGSLLAAVFKAFPQETVRQFDLVGRRRIDQSLRRTGLLVRVPAEDEGTTTSYQFPETKKKTKCDYLGVAGRPAIGRKSPGSYLVIQPSGIRAAKLSREPETRELIVGQDTLNIGTKDLDKLSKWADENEGIVRLFISRKFNYEDIMKLVTTVAYRCEDREYATDAYGQEKITVTCGKGSDRDVTVVLGLCK